ncbi:MAG: hypothetical protein JSS95_03835 [Acidobacteria bacterium]|nr:hypothetical protein [Acidobacteriota bacterium]
MPRPRKTVEQLKLSGTYQANKGRYAARLNAKEASNDLHSVHATRFRAPRHFSKEERAAHKEIMTTCPGLIEADRLLIEIAAVILARQRAGVAKTSELNKLASLLEKFRARVATASATTPSDTTITGDYTDRNIIRSQQLLSGQLSRDEYIRLEEADAAQLTGDDKTWAEFFRDDDLFQYDNSLKKIRS